MQKEFSGWLAYGVLLVVSSLLLGLFLWNSHQRAWETAENRLAFSSLLIAERELARSRRTGGWVSLLLVDVDHFKSINDTHGHLVGDRALQAFAHCCTSVTRADDVVGRWGGDEFVVLIAQDSAAVTILAERLLAAIQSAGVVTATGQPVPLNASIGLACVRADQPVSLDELLHRADLSMLHAKEHGRGRIGVFNAGQDPSILGPRLGVGDT